MYAKSFKALDGNGRLTGARTAQTAPYDRYTCHLCGSALQYHPEYQAERPWFEHQPDPAWFEHDTQTVARDVLMNCAHLDPEVKAEARRRKLRNMLNGLDATVMTLSWYCVVR